MCRIGQHQFEATIGQDVPHRLPVHTRRRHCDVRALVLGQPLRHRNQVRSCRREGARLLDDFAIDRETDAGDHRLLVNVETTTTGMQDFHDALLTRRRRRDPTQELYRSCSGANDGPWRQAEVLQDPWVQLLNGLDCTKEKPTSVPTTPEKSTLPFHPAVGRQGRWETTEWGEAASMVDGMLAEP